jgi:hypothetical protein
MAASVPRFLRQTKLGYLPLKCIVGSRLLRGDGGANLYFDIIMLPVPEFVRMRTNVGLQHVLAPALKAGPTFNPGYVLADTKQVIVPENEPDPEAYAKSHFLTMFGLLAPQAPEAETLHADKEPAAEDKGFSAVAKHSTTPAPRDKK